MIRALQVTIDVPAADSSTAARFWTAALGHQLGAPWPNHPEFRSFEPVGSRPYVHLQETTVGPPGVHLDVEVDHRDAARERLVDLGAVAGPRLSDWQVMTSPGGMPFCLVDHDAAAVVSAPQRHADGHRSRLVQVCVDAPPGAHDAEVAFWRAATGWDWRGSDASEFAGKLRPSPPRVQLLFQRLESDDPGTGVRAHIDMGTDDRSAEVARLVALGASPGNVGDAWQVLTDPTGMTFCVTDNSPD